VNNHNSSIQKANNAIEWLEKHELSACENNFAVALRLHSKHCHEEILKLNQLDDNKINQPLMDELFLFCDTHNNQHEQASHQLTSLIEEALQHIQSGTENSKLLNQSISDTQGDLEDKKDINNLMHKFSTVISGIQNHQNTLTSRLQLVEEQANHLRDELEDSKIQATQDEVTGLCNRLALKQISTKWIKEKIPMTMIIFDIDHFKRFNDSFGHLVGDKVLKRVAEEIEKQIGSENFVARYGGEEFLVLCRNINIPQTIELANTIRIAISKLKLRYRDHSLPKVTISGGVSILLENETMEDVIERADAALYRAKNSGRNKIQSMTDNSFDK
jgi:diguanylate cyclase